MKDCCKEKIIDIINKMKKLTKKTKQLQDILDREMYDTKTIKTKSHRYWRRGS